MSSSLSSPTRRRLRTGLYGGTMALAVAVAAGPLVPAVAEAVDPSTATVSGVVYVDTNKNRTRDAGEAGVPGVTVSDGVTVVTTDAEGRYALTMSTTRRKTDSVFVTQPSGYSVGTDEFKTPRFYRNLGELAKDAAVTADFDLVKTPASGADKEFYSFANVADPHVNKELPDQIEEINSTTRELGFVQVSGDLTNRATDEEFQYYLDATKRSKLPVWPAVGNHEYFYGGATDYASRIDNYRRYVGPEWYSFDYGNRHYIVLENNGQAPFEEQLEWAKADLAANVKDKKLVVIAHKPMNVPFGADEVYDAYGKLLEQYKAQLILVGHEHSNDAEPNSQFVKTAKHLQTVSASYTIDNAPRGFRFVHLQSEEFTNPFRQFGYEQQLTIMSPAPGSTVSARGNAGLQVNAYDTSDPAVKVQYRLDGGRWQSMRSTGSDYTWTATPKLRPGRHNIEVRATDGAGRSWKETTRFRVTAAKTVAPTAGGEWGQHHGDAAHTGVAPALSAPKQLAWVHNTKGWFLTGSPVISKGVVYAGTRDENGEGKSAVHAVDLKTGKTRWVAPIASSVHGSVAVADGKVFVPSLRGVMYALDAATGKELWRYTPEAAPEPYNQRTYGYYSVTVADGKVFWPYQTRFGKAREGLLAALDMKTGKAVWESPMSGSTMSDGTAAVADGKVFVGNETADQVLAYDLKTGKRLWTGKAELGGWQDGVPTADDGRVYIGSGNGIIARNAETGQKMWSFRSPHASLVSSNSTPSAPAVKDDIVYMGFPSGAVTALDAVTGEVVWDTLLPGELYKGGIHSSPVVAGNVVLVGSNNGSFYALDRRTGKVVFEHEIGSWVAAGPAVSGNTVVVGAYDGNLYAYTADVKKAKAHKS